MLFYLGLLLSTLILSKYISSYRTNKIKALGKSRVTWTSHKPFKIKDSLIFGSRSGIRFEPKAERNTYLVETSDNIEDIEQVRTTSHDLDGGFNTSINDVEGVKRTILRKYLGKHGIVDNVYVEDGDTVGSDNRSTLENEIRNSTIIITLIVNYVLLLFVGCSDRLIPYFEYAT